jgi:hypothetical protein
MKTLLHLTVTAVALSILSTPADARRRREPPPPQAAEVPQQPALPPPDDTAKFLAGMPVPKNSPLAPLTQSPAWPEHSQYFEKNFARLNTGKLQKLRNWQNTYLPESKEPIPVAYYMFSGPDFLYVDQFFPNADVYIMCGKESMGPPPDPLRVVDLPGALAGLRNAMKSSLTATYFITQDMKVDLELQQLRGTIPILYVFLARANKSIRDVTYGSLDRNGAFHESAPGRGGTPGVRISYIDNQSRRKQTLFYFTTDISDGGISSSPGFMNFCHQHGVGASFLKSSSYLMFEDGFSKVRDFILDHSKVIVQDDSGIPLANFNRDKWNLRVFGTYVGPIDIFKQHYQPRLTELFQQSNPPPFGIGFGYQWDYHKSNLIVAQRN